VALLSFYEYCISTGLAHENPTSWLPKVKPPSPRPRPAPDDIWEALLAAAPPRERLMAMLAAEAGLRRAEVTRVHKDDLLSISRPSLIVKGKGGKQRVVPINPVLAARIRERCAELASVPGWAGYLFPGAVDGHLSVVYVGQLISALMPDGYTMHTLRHRMASRAYRGSRNLRAVQTLLGHASVATTERYCAVDDDEIRAAAACAW
jgi:integrase